MIANNNSLKIHNQSKSLFSSIARLFILITPSIWATKAILDHDGFKDANSWQITDYLINYESGFVRRGLLGTILLSINRSGIYLSPSAVSLTLTLLSLWLAALYWISRTAKRNFWPSALVAFSPAFISVFYFLDTQGAGRKDALAILMLLTCIVAFERLNGTTRLIILGAIMLTIFPLLILSHEVIFFYSFLPLLSMLMLSANRAQPGKIKKVFLQAACLSLPALITLGFVIIVQAPTESDTLAKCQAWTSTISDLSCKPLPSYFDALVNYKTYKDMATNGLRSPKFYISLIISLFYLALILQGPLCRICGNSLKSERQPSPMATVLLIFALCFAFSLPLYFIACDFGRWFFVPFTSLAILTCSRNYAKEVNQIATLIFPFATKNPDTSLSSTKELRLGLVLAAITPFLFLPHFAAAPYLLFPSNHYAKSVIYTIPLHAIRLHMIPN